MINREKTKKIIETKGLKLAWLAEQCGVSQGYLGQILKGSKQPSPTLIVALAAKLGVSETDLK